MAEVTGLSQSQVYKWCWDQKKKQNKGRDDDVMKGHFDRRKIIRKSLSYRCHLSSRFEEKEQENQENMVSVRK